MIFYDKKDLDNYGRTSVENGRKKSRSDPFRFLLCSVRFRICEIRKRERGFSVRFCRILFSSGKYVFVPFFIPFSIYVRYV